MFGEPRIHTDKKILGKAKEQKCDMEWPILVSKNDKKMLVLVGHRAFLALVQACQMLTVEIERLQCKRSCERSISTVSIFLPFLDTRIDNSMSHFCSFTYLKGNGMDWDKAGRVSHR
jgi:hypothetical protein